MRPGDVLLLEGDPGGEVVIRRAVVDDVRDEALPPHDPCFVEFSIQLLAGGSDEGDALALFVGAPGFAYYHNASGDWPVALMGHFYLSSIMLTTDCGSLVSSYGGKLPCIIPKLRSCRPR